MQGAQIWQLHLTALRGVLALPCLFGSGAAAHSQCQAVVMLLLVSVARRAGSLTAPAAAL